MKCHIYFFVLVIILCSCSIFNQSSDSYESKSHYTIVSRELTETISPDSCRIQGIIYDGELKEPIEYCEIWIDNEKKIVLDTHGAIDFKILKGVYTIKFFSSRNSQLTLKNITFDGGEIVKVEIHLGYKRIN